MTPSPPTQEAKTLLVKLATKTLQGAIHDARAAAEIPGALEDRKLGVTGGRPTFVPAQMPEGSQKMDLMQSITFMQE